MNAEQQLRIKQTHKYASDYYRSWVPLLPTYETYNMKIIRLCEAFKNLADKLLLGYHLQGWNLNTSLMDFLRTNIYSDKFKLSVANEITDKGYCSTKSMYYYGIKLQALFFHRPDYLPFAESIEVTAASENDLNVHKQNRNGITNLSSNDDKICTDTEQSNEIERFSNFQILTLVKDTINQLKSMNQWDKVTNNLYSGAISIVRQPIESLFTWINEKTDIQRISQVRSTKRHLVHVFSEITAAFIFLVFNFLFRFNILMPKT